MSDNDYDPIGGHTKEEADAAYEALLGELHGYGLPGGQREKVAVVGHVWPDTDCVCAAIAYARLKDMTDPGREHVPFRAGPLNEETEYVLRRFGAPVPELFPGPAGKGAKTILVDHNKKSRLPDGVDMKYDVIEIIDHHRLREVETAVPIRVRCEPCGATGTILYGMYLENGLVPDAQAAGLLCAGIISDTWLLRTEKTARADRLACAALANIAGVDIEELAGEMFRA